MTNEIREPYGYGEFKLGDLYEVTGTKSTNAGNLTFVKEGINFVGRTETNNGVQGKVKRMDFEPNEGNTITVSQVGTMVAKYQEDEYYTSQNVAKINTTELNKKQNLYVASVINKKLLPYLGYNTPKLIDIKEFEMEMPITEEGTIDYEYMESYIEHIQQKYVDKLEQYYQEEISNLQLILEGGGN